VKACWWWRCEPLFLGLDEAEQDRENYKGSMTGPAISTLIDAGHGETDGVFVGLVLPVEIDTGWYHSIKIQTQRVTWKFSPFRTFRLDVVCCESLHIVGCNNTPTTTTAGASK
jgi:hypothetical protein